MLNKAKENAIIFGLSTSEDIAKNVAKILDVELGEYKKSKFKDGEIFVESTSSVRGKSVFIIQSTCTPVNDNLMELILFVDALKRSSAGQINLVIPYFGYARQDRRAFGRQPISAKVVANMLTTAGVDSIVTFDIHSEQIVGFFDIPFDNLRAQGLIARELENLNIDDLTIVSPDHGGVSRARQLAQLLDAPLAVIDKRRTGPNQAEAMFILGEVKGRNVVIFDDMVDSGGTVVTATNKLVDAGAKDVYLAVTHPVLSGTEFNENQAIDNLRIAGVKNVITTNSIQHQPDQLLKVIDLSGIIAEMIEMHLSGKSITDHFITKYNTKL